MGDFILPSKKYELEIKTVVKPLDKDTKNLHPNETVVPLEISQYLKKPILLKPLKSIQLGFLHYLSGN